VKKKRFLPQLKKKKKKDPSLLLREEREEQHNLKGKRKCPFIQ